jgi:hypothetical protein
MGVGAIPNVGHIVALHPRRLHCRLRELSCDVESLFFKWLLNMPRIVTSQRAM